MIRLQVVMVSLAFTLVMGVGSYSADSIITNELVIVEEYLVPNENQIVPVYEVNENNQTYGIAADATSFETEPDLILVMNNKGISGYVYKKDLYGEAPERLLTPEEITEINKRSEIGYVIPMYEKDGETVIGEFQVGGGFSSEEALPDKIYRTLRDYDYTARSLKM